MDGEETSIDLVSMEIEMIIERKEEERKKKTLGRRKKQTTTNQTSDEEDDGKSSEEVDVYDEPDIQEMKIWFLEMGFLISGCRMYLGFVRLWAVDYV